MHVPFELPAAAFVVQASTPNCGAMQLSHWCQGSHQLREVLPSCLMTKQQQISMPNQYDWGGLLRCSMWSKERMERCGPIGTGCSGAPISHLCRCSSYFWSCFLHVGHDSVGVLLTTFLEVQGRTVRFSH